MSPSRPLPFDVRFEPSVQRPLPAEAARRLRRALTGGATRVVPAGLARDDPGRLLRGATRPRYGFRLFGYEVWVSQRLVDPFIGFHVAYVGRARDDGRPPATLHPRIFYKDVGLMWRSATHVIDEDDELWIGKGAVRTERVDGDEVLTSAEETTDLPYEMQPVLDWISHQDRPVTHLSATTLVLRGAPRGRLRPYADFERPRARDMALYRVNGGRPIARFRRRRDPASLEFTPGFEPDVARGVLEVAAEIESRFYGGTVRKVRVASANRRVQYLFNASPTHVWLSPPQAFTTSLSTYGPRTVDVLAPEDLFVPGFEYHFLDDAEDPPALHSQIPEGFAGDAHPDDPLRADASRWVHRLAPVQAFRRAAARGGPRVREAARAEVGGPGPRN